MGDSEEEPLGRQLLYDFGFCSGGALWGTDNAQCTEDSGPHKEGNGLSEACKKHDICLAECGCEDPKKESVKKCRGNCDEDLSKRAKNANCDNSGGFWDKCACMTSAATVFFAPDSYPPMSIGSSVRSEHQCGS